MHNRRSFLKNTSQFALGASLLPHLAFAKKGAISAVKPQFRMCLNGGAIGVEADLEELLSLAKQHGFQAIIADPGELANMEDGELQDFLDEMKAADITWGSAGLPMDFRKDETTFQQGLKALPNYAKALERAGATRMNTWIMPTQDERTYLENFKLHQKRLKEVANVLGHHGVRFGLEYVGPKTLMARDKYAFIRSMAEAKELLAAIDEPNIGLVLDSFHWFCAGESAADILTLDKEDIVTCDLNDARAGFSAAEQIDGKRELPTATGVIDLKAFLGVLTQIGYDGPVRAEPFNAELRNMGNQQAVKTTAEAMQKAFALVD